MIQYEASFSGTTYGLARTNMSYASFKPFYFYDLSWLLVPIYEICQLAGGLTIIFQAITSVTRSATGKTLTTEYIITRILLGLLLATSWLPLMIYNSLNKKMLNDIQTGNWIDLFESGIINRSERILTWFVWVKSLIIVIRKNRFEMNVILFEVNFFL